jgi:hypothetical protein
VPALEGGGGGGGGGRGATQQRQTCLHTRRTCWRWARGREQDWRRSRAAGRLGKLEFDSSASESESESARAATEGATSAG